MVLFGQGFKDMSPLSNALIKLVLEVMSGHSGHLSLSCMVDSIHVAQDPAGNIKPDKQKSTEKIDGVVVTIMALTVPSGTAPGMPVAETTTNANCGFFDKNQKRLLMVFQPTVPEKRSQEA